MTRPAVAVKVEDSPAARPQSGLEHADVVYEEIVEGGITRFMVIYHCGDSKQVGPVRSARFDDPKIAAPFTRAVAYSGSNAIVERELHARNMVAIDEDNADGGLYRVPPGTFEIHNLFANTKKLRALKPVKKVPPPRGGLFEFGDLPEGGKPTKRVRVNFTASNTIEYRWQGKSWRRFEAGAPFFSGTGDQIAVPNVLIQQVRVDNSARIVDSAGNPSPDISLMGTGRAVLFRNGRAFKGKWTIKREGRPARFTTRGGEPLLFAPGSTWVELVPSRKGNVKGAFSFK